MKTTAAALALSKGHSQLAAKGAAVTVTSPSNIGPAPGKLSEIPPFVTAPELETINQFADQLRELDRHQVALCPPALEANVAAAQAKYMKSPTGENFDHLRTACVAQAQYSILLGSPIAGIVEGASKALEKKIMQCARPILERALSRAQARYSKIEARERAHHDEITGESLPPDPPPPPPSANQLFGRPKSWRDSNLVLAAARRPIENLERMIRGPVTRELLRFLRDHAVV